jgi:hypothetical protein
VTDNVTTEQLHQVGAQVAAWAAEALLANADKVRQLLKDSGAPAAAIDQLLTDAQLKVGTTEE